MFSNFNLSQLNVPDVITFTIQKVSSMILWKTFYPQHDIMRIMNTYL